MKKICIFLLSLLLCLSQSQTVLAGQNSIDTIIEIVYGLTGYGVITTDVAKEKITLSSDKITITHIDGGIVQKEIEDWARNEVWSVIKKRIGAINEKGYLTPEKYESSYKDFYDLSYSELPIRLGTVYKSYIRFEEEVIRIGAPLIQEKINTMIIAKVKALLDAKNITQEQHNIWIVKVQRQIFEYKTDPDLVYRNFLQEIQPYDTIVIPVSVTCGDVSCQGTTTENRYYSVVKKQNIEKYQKLSIKVLERTLENTKKLEKKYKTGSSSQLKTAAKILLLENVIGFKKAQK